MRLSTLLKEIYPLPAQADSDINRLVLDSRHIQSGDLFVAIKGVQLDGRCYISDALAQGAAAVLIDADAPDQALTYQQDKPLISIYQLQQKLGLLAARFYNYPADNLYMFGVTGTNGKTSCTHFIAQALASLNIPCGLIGTLGSGLYGRLVETGLTTPDAIMTQAALRQCVDQGAKAVAMEVSSHSIDQGRVNHIPFNVGVFTNLTQDHLDYHGDMQRYAAVKRRFLSELPVKQLVINADDAYGLQWLSELQSTKSVYAYTLNKPTEALATVPLIYADQVELSLQGIKAKVHSPWGVGHLVLPLIGQFNLSNALAALTSLCLYGLEFKQVLACFSQLTTVPGRMQTLGGQGRPLVVVDYAHTPDALEKVLKALRLHTSGQLTCVFGCGGDRDHGKRPLMAQMAEQYADRVIVTNDNPRHEQPEVIANQIMAGFSHPERISLEFNRSKAIQNSIQWAKPVDCILIAGKGAERYQQVGDIKTPFDDVEQVRRVLDAAIIK
jgi:UDP-N-acetylmuramoyl-L-alanyl-D-glutamate--2,6-diaminopimelate ligase